MSIIDPSYILVILSSKTLVTFSSPYRRRDLQPTKFIPYNKNHRHPKDFVSQKFIVCKTALHFFHFICPLQQSTAIFRRYFGLWTYYLLSVSRHFVLPSKLLLNVIMLSYTCLFYGGKLCYPRIVSGLCAFNSFSYAQDNGEQFVWCPPQNFGSIRKLLSSDYPTVASVVEFLS